MAFFRTIKVRSMESGFSRSRRRQFGGPHRGFDVAVSRNHDYFGMVLAFDQLLQRFQAIHARQPDIEQDHVGGFMAQHLQTLLTAFGEQVL